MVGCFFQVQGARGIKVSILFGLRVDYGRQDLYLTFSNCVSDHNFDLLAVVRLTGYSEDVDHHVAVKKMVDWLEVMGERKGGGRHRASPASLRRFHWASSDCKEMGVIKSIKR